VQPEKVVGAVAAFEYLMSVLAVNVRPLLGLPCVKVGVAAVPTSIWLGSESISSTELLSTAVVPVFNTRIEYCTIAPGIILGLVVPLIGSESTLDVSPASMSRWRRGACW
jgi:hypothetical protein